MKLQGKVALITGAGSGLGREMGLTFAREGAVIGVNDIKPESAQNVATEIERAGGRARPFVADVSSSAAVDKMFAEFLKTYGTIDILINNAGIGRTRDEPAAEFGGTSGVTDEDFDKMIRTHLYSTFYCTRAALRVMQPKKSGRIVNLGSIAGTTGLGGATAYSAAKGAIISFSKALAKEVVVDGILVNCIAPGFIETPMTAPITPEMKAQVCAQTPIGRFGEPADIAAAALFLVSDDSRFMVGQIVSPNGGFVI